VIEHSRLTDGYDPIGIEPLEVRLAMLANGYEPIGQSRQSGPYSPQSPWLQECAAGRRPPALAPQAAGHGREARLLQAAQGHTLIIRAILVKLLCKYILQR
jgi:hypothetical protein